MALRTIARTVGEGVISRRMAELNARHPWSHNDHFHSWILANLPTQRRTALDVGCGQGGLVTTLAPHFDAVHGSDLDPAMRQQATERCAGLPNVTIGDEVWTAEAGSFDLVTMVAVLHHLEVSDALRHVERVLAPGGRFLAVGLAPPHGLLDHAWDLASIVTNPIIGYVKHPWPSTAGPQQPSFPVQEPTLSFGELRALVGTVMPGASMRHRLGFRHTIRWTKPS